MSDTYCFDTGFLFSANPVQISTHFCTKFPFLPNIVQILLFFCTKLSFCYNIVQIMAHFYTIISSATPSCNSKGPQNGLRYGWQSIPDVPNFLTRKCPSASQKRHFLKQTEIFGPSGMIAYATSWYFVPHSVAVRCFIIYENMRLREWRIRR